MKCTRKYGCELSIDEDGVAVDIFLPSPSKCRLCTEAEKQMELNLIFKEEVCQKKQ